MAVRVCCVSATGTVTSILRSYTGPTSSKCLNLRTFLTSSIRRTNRNEESSNTHNPQESHTSQSDKDEHEYEHEVRQQILKASLPHVHEHGWTRKALEAGARDEGLPPVVHGMFPRGGAELIHYFYVKSNSELAEVLRLQVENAKSQGIQKIPNQQFFRSALETRLKMIVPYLDTWPQAMAISTLPQNAAESLTNLLKLVDNVWYYSGDSSVDFNWYTKRLSLAAVYKSTEIYMIQDKSPDQLDTWTFLDNRLENLQQLSAAKKSCEQSKDILREAFVGFSIMGRNILGFNSRNR